MDPSSFLAKSRDPEEWRKHARSLRRSADVLWKDFTEVLLTEVSNAKTSGVAADLICAHEALETCKLLYGLSLETALKAWIIQHHPKRVEFRLSVDGAGTPTHAELRALGVPSGNGHNLLALAEAAGLFGDGFKHAIRFITDERAVRNICRDLTEVVVWRGRYPIPLASQDPLKLDPKGLPHAQAHFMRDWLDPVLDALLSQGTPFTDA